MMEQLSTSPYLSKRRETSDSERRGCMPVTKRFEPVLTAPSSSASFMRVSEGGGGLEDDQRGLLKTSPLMFATHALSRPLGERLRFLSSRSPRGDADLSR